MKKSFLLLLVTIFPLTGCLDFELKHKLFLEADGSVTWQVQVQDTRIGETARQQEERLEEIPGEQEAIIQALIEAGGSSPSLVTTRDLPPYEYVVQARFESLEQVLELLYENWPQLQLRQEEHEGRSGLGFLVEDQIYPDAGRFERVELILANGGKFQRDGAEDQAEPGLRMCIDRPQDWSRIKIIW